MENHSYSSNPNSHESSPHSREIECENPPWEEPPSSYKVKFLCSYGGKIQPRPHDNQLAYVGGDTKILSVDRNVKFSFIVSKLSSICDGEMCFKYQLPGEDLDALISVTNDEDLDHMMLEYDRLYRASSKPARLRLFLFPVNPPAQTSFDSNSSKSERQWFVDALNSVQVQPMEGSSPPAGDPKTNPDFLFGLEKGAAAPDQATATKSQEPISAPSVLNVIQKENNNAGLDRGSEDRVVDPGMSQMEIQRQIHELQRLQIAASQEQAILQRKSDEINPNIYTGEYYTQKIPAPMPIQTAYWPERPIAAGGYQMANVAGTEKPLYMIPAHGGGIYQSQGVRPVAAQLNQAYYGMQRMMPEVHQPYPVPQPSIQQSMVRPLPPNTGLSDAGYTQVGFDNTGRQVFYTNTATTVVPPSYQAAAPVNQSVALNPESKVVNTVKTPQT